MGIVTDEELRRGKRDLADALVAKGVDARGNERLSALALKVAGVSSGGGSGGTPEKFIGITVEPPMPGLSVATLLTPPPTTWNPSDKQADVVLSNGNLTATCALAENGIYHSVRSTTSKTSGKWYYECNAGGSSAYVVSAGLNSGDAELTTLANRSNGIAYSKFYEGIIKDLYNVQALTALVTDTIGVAIDLDAQTVSYYKNGIFVATINSFTKNPVFAMVSVGAGVSITANFAPTVVPAGYSAWDS